MLGHRGTLVVGVVLALGISLQRRKRNYIGSSTWAVSTLCELACDCDGLRPLGPRVVEDVRGMSETEFENELQHTKE